MNSYLAYFIYVEIRFYNYKTFLFSTYLGRKISKRYATFRNIYYTIDPIIYYDRLLRVHAKNDFPPIKYAGLPMGFRNLRKDRPLTAQILDLSDFKYQIIAAELFHNVLDL